MAFINELPSAQDVEKYALPFENDLKQPPEERWRIWTRDHERNFYLWGGGSGDPAHDIELKWDFDLYLNGDQFRVIMPQGGGSLVFTDDPYIKHYESIEKILRVVPQLARIDPETGVALPIETWRVDRRAVELSKNYKGERLSQRALPASAWQTPDAAQPLLGGRSLNEFIGILKEALTVRGAGDYNPDVHGEMIVRFGF